MHRILEQVCAIAERERAEWLPEVTPQQLEQDGAVFYMNSQNGTEFDWYVNDRLPSFMVFYNDKANLGAVKLHLNRNGDQAAKAGDTPGGVYRGGASRAGGAAAAGGG